MAGAGPTAHVPQVTAFETAAITHTQQATQMAATAAATAASFVGAGGQSMMQCAAVQSTWMTTAGAFAQKSAGTIGAGINAYGSAVAATIPVPTVVANRVREATLQATNIIGQNNPAIAESNFEYGEFWAQNAGAMMGYLTAITGLVGSLAAPLPVLPGAANPAAAAAAGAAATGMSLGLQGAGWRSAARPRLGRRRCRRARVRSPQVPGRWLRRPARVPKAHRPASPVSRRVPLPVRAPLPVHSRPIRLRRCSRPRE